MPDHRYRCYCSNAGQVVSSDIIECDSDGAALRICTHLLAHSRNIEVLEVWERDRQVGVLERPSQYVR